MVVVNRGDGFPCRTVGLVVIREVERGVVVLNLDVVEAVKSSYPYVTEVHE